MSQQNPQYNYANPQPSQTGGFTPPVPPPGSGFAPPPGPGAPVGGYAPPQVSVRPVVRPPVTKNKFLTFLCALLPGAGQMYHGLLKKGLSIMLLFFGVIAVSSLTYLGPINLILPVIWFYSFFDTVNRMNMPAAELRMLQDDWLFATASDSPKLDGFSFSKLFRERHVLFGWLIILLAVWILLNSLFSAGWFGYGFWVRTVGIAEGAYYMLRDAISFLPVLIIPALCVYLGAKLISGGKKPKKTYDEYTIPEEPPQAGS